MEKQPSDRRKKGGRAPTQKHTGSDPPQHAMPPPAVQASYPPTDESAWRHIYALAKRPWVFVPIVGTYWTLSVIQLFAKLSAFNVFSFLASTFVLILAVLHNLVPVMDCLGTIFRQIGKVFRTMGTIFGFAGTLLRRAARRLRTALDEV